MPKPCFSESHTRKLLTRITNTETASDDRVDNSQPARDAGIMRVRFIMQDVLREMCRLDAR